MAITFTLNAEDGEFVPFHTAVRGGPEGMDPVGTLSVDGGGAGDSSGDPTDIQILFRATMFGFRALFIPTQMVVSDNLAAAEVVAVSYVLTGNRRVNGSLLENVVTIAGPQASNVGVAELAGLPIEGTDEVNRLALQATWSTNTNLKLYHLHVFGPVFDLEVVERHGQISELLSGIR